jgi:hypothetical protein
VRYSYSIAACKPLHTYEVVARPSSSAGEGVDMAFKLPKRFYQPMLCIQQDVRILSRASVRLTEQGSTDRLHAL